MYFAMYIIQVRTPQGLSCLHILKIINCLSSHWCMPINIVDKLRRDRDSRDMRGRYCNAALLNLFVYSRS